MPHNELDREIAPEDLATWLSEYPQWQLRQSDSAAPRLYRLLEFGSFADAIAFIVRSSFAAEGLDHHPNWSNVYSRVEVAIFHHEVQAISRRCITLATALEQAARGLEVS